MPLVRRLAAVAFAFLVLGSSAATAQCIRTVDVDRDLPHEVETPQGNHLSYSYDLVTERYYVAASRGQQGGMRHGPYALTRGCDPARLEWESREFVVLTAGCGTFCWRAQALSVIEDRAAQNLERPLLFDRGRNLLAYYADGDLLRIRKLATGFEQDVRTPGCVSASDTCMKDVQLTATSFDYTFERYPSMSEPPTLERISVPLEAPLLATSPDGYDVLDVKLEIVPDVAARSISARQAMTLHAEIDLRDLKFDANALSLGRPTLGGDAGSWSVDERSVVLTLPRIVRAGEIVTLQFDYGGVPARGLVFDDASFYTSYFTCDWMVCALDRPGDKFVLDVDVTVPAGWRSFASEAARGYPAYVQGFGAGAWTEVRERIADTQLVYASAHATEADLRAMFAETLRMLEFYRDVAGVPFPHATYTQLLVPGAAAQEGAGFAILGDDVVRPVLTEPSDDWAVAHELAHQYWGNLLTCADWSHFWLNEGLATFMTAAWKQHRWGENAYERELATAAARWSAARAAGWDKPLAFGGAYPDLRTRRAIQYSKGMLFFVELRRVLGDAAFWRGIGAYTRAHAGGVVVSADLERALEAESGVDLSALFAQWVYE